MGSRLKLQAELEAILGSDEVYFQPPESVRIHYPAIIYKKKSGMHRYADDMAYLFMPKYQITIIDYNPDAEWDRIMIERFKYVYIENHYTSDNLNHWVYRVYY